MQRARASGISRGPQVFIERDLLLDHVIAIDLRAFFFEHRLGQALGRDARPEAQVARSGAANADAEDGVGSRSQLGNRLEDQFLALEMAASASGAWVSAFPDPNIPRVGTPRQACPPFRARR